MSDDEEYSEEEAVVERKPAPAAPAGDEHHEAQGADILKQRQAEKRAELDEQLKEYIAEWRKQRVKEEEDLKRLKDKQAKRKVMREEEDKKLATMKKDEEDRLRRMIEEKKQNDMEEKRQRLAKEEQKRQVADKAAKDKANASPNFKLGAKKVDAGPAAMAGGMDKFSNVESARNDLLKSKEQLEEEKKISLSFRIKPLEIDGLGIEGLKKKATSLWEQIVLLETEKYDLEERSKRQDYDLKELKERQKQQLRHKALKRGLDPEALTGKYPPKIQLASKFERRVDHRNYEDKKGTLCWWLGCD